MKMCVGRGRTNRESEARIQNVEAFWVSGAPKASADRKRCFFVAMPESAIFCKGSPFDSNQKLRLAWSIYFGGGFPNTRKNFPTEWRWEAGREKRQEPRVLSYG